MSIFPNMRNLPLSSSSYLSVQSLVLRYFGHVKHAESFIFLQQLVLHPNLLSQRGQLLLHQRTALCPGYVKYLLPSLLKLNLQFGQLVVDIFAILVHAYFNVVNQMQQRIFVDCVNCVVKLINDKPKG